MKSGKQPNFNFRIPNFIHHKPRALWIWDSAKILLNEQEKTRLFNFCHLHHINRLWMQIVFTQDPKEKLSFLQIEKSSEPITPAIRFPEKTRIFLKEAHQNGIFVEALDGCPEYCQKKFHHLPLVILDSLIQFNKLGNSEERYDGVHFDNEPYLLLGWHTQKRKQQILEEFGHLAMKCRSKLRKHSSMHFGIDIPFWFLQVSGNKERSNPNSESLSQKSIAHFLLEHVDSIGIMDYRNTASGEDGIIAHASQLLIDASKGNHSKVYVGIETSSIPPTPVWFALGHPLKTFEHLLNSKKNNVSYLNRLNGFKIRVLKDSTYAHVGIELPNTTMREENPEVLETVIEIAKQFGIRSAGANEEEIKQARDTAEVSVARDPEFQNYIPKEIEGNKQPLPGFMATSIMLPKITFANKGNIHLNNELQLAEKSFSEHSSYSGFAIHCYESFRKMIS